MYMYYKLFLLSRLHEDELEFFPKESNSQADGTKLVVEMTGINVEINKCIHEIK